MPTISAIYAYDLGDVRLRSRRFTGEHGFLDDVHVLDTAVEPMMWTRPGLTGARPAPRCGHEANVLGGDVVVWGGMSTKGFM